MRLRILTPSSIVVDDGEVVSIRGEDATGSFGVGERHAEFVTLLAISVLSWRNASGKEHRAAVRGGVLRIERGGLVEVATREAVVGDDLRDLDDKVVARLREAASTEARERTRAAQLDAAVVRQIDLYVRGRRPHGSMRLGRLGREEEGA